MMHLNIQPKQDQWGGYQYTKEYIQGNQESRFLDLDIVETDIQSPIEESHWGK